jgi:hypothetical protein
MLCLLQFGSGKAIGSFIKFLNQIATQSGGVMQSDVRIGLAEIEPQQYGV